MTKIKICGITDRAALDAAAQADFIGFVFHPASPRFLTPQKATALAAAAAPALKKVGVFVDPDDALLESVFGLNLIQLHGNEPPQRVADIARRTGLPVIKALTVARADDVTKARLYEDSASWLLFDAGQGGGKAFDWRLLEGFQSRLPWLLAGGLTADNVAAALKTLRPDGVDVSGGVESAPGQKDPDLILKFIKTVRDF